MRKNISEIEIKLIFKNKNKIISTLSPGIKFIKRFCVKDKYYGKNKKIRNNNYFLRIREVKNKNKKDIELTYKGRAKNKENIIKRSELSVKISSREITEKILTNLGFKKISEHQSKRELWNLNGTEIIFTKFTSPAYLEFMEIEATSQKKIKDILARVKGLCKKMNEKAFNIFDRK